MPGPAEREHQPIEYRDRRQRLWYISEVARMRVVSAPIDGPSYFLVIRFEREGEERFAGWISGDDWRQRGALHRLFAEAKPGDLAESEPVAVRRNLTTRIPASACPTRNGRVVAQARHDDGTGRVSLVRGANVPAVGPGVVRWVARGDSPASSGAR
jgi:hypothetical protein